MSEHNGEGPGEGRGETPLTARERAKEWRKAAYQKAKAAHKERQAAHKLEPAAIARKELQAEYRRSTYQKQKDRHKAGKEAARVAGAERDAQEEQEALAAKEAELRELVTTADQLGRGKDHRGGEVSEGSEAGKVGEVVKAPPRRGLRLVKAGEA